MACQTIRAYLAGLAAFVVFIAVVVIVGILTTPKYPDPKHGLAIDPIIGGKSVTMLFCNMPRDSTGRSLGFIWHAHSLPDSVWYLWGVVSPQGLLELQEMAGHGLDLDTMPPTVLVNTKGFLPFGRKEIE